MPTMHTAGPWRIETWTYDNGPMGKDDRTIIQTDSDAIAHIWDVYRPDDIKALEKSANARLIAAAPEMYTLLDKANNGALEYHDWERIRSLLWQIDNT